jgi:hypothetical protein
MLRFTLPILAACSSTPVTTSSAPAAPPTATTAAASAVDSDGDGVPDDCDYCPRQPGIDRADHPYGRGCPYIDQFVSTVEFVGAPIAFGSGLSYTRSLDAIASGMRADAHVTFFVIGHATPDEPNAGALALQRAETIRSALVALGVAASSMQAFAASPSSLGGKSVTFDASYDRARKRIWDPALREVVYVPLPDLCAAHN